jgi:hypothetical protein
MRSARGPRLFGIWRNSRRQATSRPTIEGGRSPTVHLAAGRCRVLTPSRTAAPVLQRAPSLRRFGWGPEGPARSPEWPPRPRCKGRGGCLRVDPGDHPTRAGVRNARQWKGRPHSRGRQLARRRRRVGRGAEDRWRRTSRRVSRPWSWQRFGQIGVTAANQPHRPSEAESMKSRRGMLANGFRTTSDPATAGVSSLAKSVLSPIGPNYVVSNVAGTT